MDYSFIINEWGEEREHYMNAVSPPIFQTVNFAFPTLADMREAISRENELPMYTRGTNPTIDMLNKKMAALEKTEAALSFASGSAAVAAAVMANVSAGDHIVCVEKPYSWTGKLLRQYLTRFGVETTFVDGKDPHNYVRAMKPKTRMFFLESPNSFTFEMQDVPAVTKLAKEHGMLTLIDNSYASPYNFNPAEWGVDIVIHAATKYISGHSDSVAGVVCGTKEMMDRLFYSELMAIGGVISPFNAWLLIRGLRTLEIRMQRVAETGMKVASWLAGQPQVRKVYYPFLSDSPDRALADKMLRNPTGQFSIELNTDEVEKVERFCNSLKRFLLSVSWGGYESLIFPALAISGPHPFSPSLIRFYTGLEDAGVLIADLKQALEQV